MDGRLAVALVLFFGSGFAALVYQVAWSRLLHLVIGVGIFAITTVVCTFMAGLALGSYVAGRFAGGLRRPLRAYGVVEGAIALYAVLTPRLFALAEPVYATALPGLGPVSLNAFRVALSALLLLVPTALMGATLPLLARAVALTDATTTRRVGLLYGVNTLGAVVGCLAAGFVLLAQLGIHRSIFAAAAVNAVIGAVAWLVPSRPAPSPSAAAGRDPGERGPEARLVLLVFFLTGFAALGYEVLWTRALLVHLKASTYAFSVMLGVYLLGLALGSAASSGLAGRSRRPLLGLGACQLGVAAAVLVGLLVFPHLEGAVRNAAGADRIDSFPQAVAVMLAQAAGILLAPTFFMGAAFPFGVAAHHRASRGVARSVGSLYAVNTLGNIGGALVVGFAMIPWIGVRDSLIAMMCINLVVSAALLSRHSRTSWGRLAAPALSLVAAWLVHTAVDEQLFLRSIAGRGSQVLYYREGASDTVAVVEHDRPAGERTLLYSDGRGASGTWTLPWNLYFGHLPMLLHPDPKEILHICIGAGNSLMSITRHAVERIDAVELSPHVREAADYFWTNEGVFGDPRVNLFVEDGRNFLLRNDRSYDVVSLEPPMIHSAGVVNLYTQEFYELVRRHMKPGGVAVQWLPTSTFSETDRAHLIRAFTEAFPTVSVWQELRSPYLLLVGALEPLAIDVERVERRLRAPAMQHDLEIMGVANAYEFLSFFLLGDASTRKLVAGVPPVRDDRTRVDYSIPLYAGSGFGLSPLLAEPEGAEIVRRRLLEYATWRDPVSEVIRAPEHAAAVERARNALGPADPPPRRSR
jgi:spermidine synthase